MRLLVVLLLLCACAGKKARGLRQRERRHERKLRSGNNLGKWEEATAPMHTTVCGDHVCRPGEGNLKGYEHWKQPYETPPLSGLSKRAAHGWSRGAPFPTAKYATLATVARSVAGSGSFLALTVADFDFRLLAENWYKMAHAVGMPALVHCLDNEVLPHLAARGVPVHNGTANLLAWAETKLQRHIQRALAERHLAAAALVDAGFDVLMTDSTHVFMRSAAAAGRRRRRARAWPGLGRAARPQWRRRALAAPPPPHFLTRRLCKAQAVPFLRAQPERIDFLAAPGSCKGRICPKWNFMFMRGSVPAARARVLKFVQSALDTGMVDFYLRWWAGHHCMFMGYEKLLRQARWSEEGSAPPNTTVTIVLKGHFCDAAGECLRLGQLPANLFPVPGAYPALKGEALVGRSNRPDKDPKRSHRLRLDRYDEIDFDWLREAMVAEGLWHLG